jgi:hypothetical protein
LKGAHLRDEALELVHHLNHAQRVQRAVFLQLPAHAATPGSGCLPVGHAGHLVGLVTADNVNEYMAVTGALRQRVPPWLHGQ